MINCSNMEGLNINKAAKKSFAWALSLSIGFPVGALCIIFGAININQGIQYIFLLALGVLLAASGFYIMPLIWIKYGEQKGYVSLGKQIIEDNLNTISLLSSSNGTTKEKMLSKVNLMIAKRYLSGYIVVKDEYIVRNNGKRLTSEDIAELTGELEVINCPSCGARVTVKNTKTYCEYCGSPLIKKAK